MEFAFVENRPEFGAATEDLMSFGDRPTAGYWSAQVRQPKAFSIAELFPRKPVHVSQFTSLVLTHSPYPAALYLVISSANVGLVVCEISSTYTTSYPVRRLASSMTDAWGTHL
jgi:hypothetical protein